MIVHGDLALLRPWFLLAVVAVVAAALAIRTRGSLGDWRRATDAPLFSALSALGLVSGTDARPRRFGPLVLAALTAAAALTGPAVRRADADAWRNLDGLVIAVDLSRSMTEGGGLSEGRFAALEVAAAAPGRQAALVVYAGDAYLAETFTADHGALGEMIAALGPDLVPDQGSDAARALGFAGERLAEAGIVAGDVVLVTDGGGLGADAAAAATALKAAGARVHVVLATSTGADGRPTDPAAAEAAAASVATAGGGRWAPATDPKAVTAAIAGEAAVRLGRSDLVALGWFDLGRPLLAVAALLLLPAFRRRR